ncbi:MAG: recombinase family protein [Minisyncoccota bacterium]
MNALTKTDAAASTDLEIFSGASVFDIARYEQVDRVASIMAAATLIPEHLKGRDYTETKGNCFMICNLAANWELDPFAVAQASSLVFGKIVLEGKLVRAVIKRHLRIDLQYRFFDEGKDNERVYVSEKLLVDASGLPVAEDAILALVEKGERITPGSFVKWHTKSKSGGVNDNWIKDRRKMMRERGAREWCREFEPGLMLGVYTVDEFDDAEHTSRSNRARDITPSTHNPLLDSKSLAAMEIMDPKTGEFIESKSEAQSGTAAKTTPPGPQGSQAPASAKLAPDGAGGAGVQSSEDARPHETPSSSTHAGGDGTGGDAGSAPARVSSDLWSGYSSALARMAKPESVEKAHKAYWQDKGIRIAHPDDIKLGTDIKTVHLQRAEGKLDGEYVAKEVAGWIADVIGEAK